MRFTYLLISGQPMQFKHLLKNAGLTLPALILLFYSYSNAQSNRDSLFQYSTSTVVITGRGYENKLANSTSAITSINKKELDPLPFNKFSDAVKYLPGFFLFNKDGLGRDPVIGVRGFYGAGEAEYIQVIQDGISLNNIETGLVNWNLIDYENIDRIEVLRGGASALYGEPAIGGVINIFTNNPQSKFNSLNFDAGSFGTFNFGAHSSGILLNNFYGLNASYNKTNGFREHSNWKKFSIGGQYKVNINNASSLNFLLSYFNIDADNPGPLSENELNKSRTSSFVFYKPDAKEERRFYLSLNYNYKSYESEFNTYADFTYANDNTIRTFVNSVPIINPADFSIVGIYNEELYGDSNEREFVNNLFVTGIKYFKELKNISIKIYSGAELNYADYNSKFYNMFSGFESEYKINSVNRAEQTNNADGSRTKLGIYFSGEYALTNFIKIDAGIRFDKINDKYQSTVPDSLIKTDNSELSPKIGFNINYLKVPGFNGNIYFNYNRSFKSPTIDQLTDISQTDFGIFLQFPGGNIFTPIKADPFSNSELKPQKSSSFEIGFYQQFKLSQNVLNELTLSLYTIDIKDEIDFDITSLRYKNIIKSNHSGIESSLKTYLPYNWLYYINYTYTKVKFTSGNFDGNRLKGIPESVLSSGIVKRNFYGFDFSLVYNLTSGIYLDDENTTTLPDFFTLDGAISYTVNNLRLSLKANNILNKKFNSTGFILNGVKYLYPFAGNVISGGISYRL